MATEKIIVTHINNGNREKVFEIHNQISRYFPVESVKGKIFDPQNQSVEDFSVLLKQTLVEVFKDFNFRTLTVNKAVHKEINDKVLPNMQIGTGEFYKIGSKKGQEKTRNAKITEFFAEQIVRTRFLHIVINYFNDIDTRSFNAIHHDLCNEFLNAIKYDGKDIYFKNLEKDPVAYGKAQKIVNMMFKHFYCMANSEKYEKYFVPCHMPVDSFTLKWLKRQDRTIEDNKLTEWSNLEYDVKESNGKYTYPELVEKMNKAVDICNGNFSDCTAYTPLQTEFIIWPEIQRIEALEAFIYNFENVITTENEDENQVDVKLQKIREMNLTDKSIRALKVAFKNVCDSNYISKEDIINMLQEQ